MHDNLDLDPPPRQSPRLYAQVGAIPHSFPTSTLSRPKPRLTPGQRDRLARDIAIFSAIENGMSQRMAAKVFRLSKTAIFKSYHRISRRKNRV